MIDPIRTDHRAHVEAVLAIGGYPVLRRVSLNAWVITGPTGLPWTGAGPDLRPRSDPAPPSRDAVRHGRLLETVARLDPATSAEVGKLFGWSVDSASARLCHLRKRGWIERDIIRSNRAQRQHLALWRLTPAGRALIEGRQP